MTQETKDELRRLAEAAKERGKTVALQPDDVLELVKPRRPGRARDKQPWHLEAIELLANGPTTKADLYTVGHNHGVREATVSQWVSRKIKRGEVERVGRGVYQNV